MSSISPFHVSQGSSPSSSPPRSPLYPISPEEKGLQDLFFKVRQAKTSPSITPPENHSPQSLSPTKDEETFSFITPYQNGAQKGKRLFNEALSDKEALLLPSPLHQDFPKKNKPLLTTSPSEDRPLFPLFKDVLSPFKELSSLPPLPSPARVKPRPQFFETGIPSHSVKPPATPRKNLAPSSPFSKVLSCAKNAFLMIGGKTVSLTFLDEGSYMNVYQPGDTPLLVPSLSNQAVVVKLYHGKNTGLSSQQLEKCLTTSLRSYKQTLDYDIPVAKIYNVETALTDCFLIQEKIPHPIQITSYLLEIFHFFELSLKHNITLDLIPDNFRVKEDGTVVLIDFVEDASEGIELFLEHALYSLCERYLTETKRDKEKAEMLLNLILEKLPELIRFISSNRWKITLEKAIDTSSSPST
ncbi:MAG: hypothetical protein QRY71_01005 [Candidatus Rhabdochlamydia sp.]